MTSKLLHRRLYPSSYEPLVYYSEVFVLISNQVPSSC